MGLIKSGVKYGGLFLVAREAGKAISNVGQSHQQQQQQQPTYVNNAAQVQPQRRDATGYLHQSWCNGQCGGYCDGESARQNVIVNGQSDSYYGSTMTGAGTTGSNATNGPPMYQRV